MSTMPCSRQYASKNSRTYRAVALSSSITGEKPSPAASGISLSIRWQKLCTVLICTASTRAMISVSRAASSGVAAAFRRFPR